MILLLKVIKILLTGKNFHLLYLFAVILTPELAAAGTAGNAVRPKELERPPLSTAPAFLAAL